MIRFAPALACLLCTQVLAQEVVISGKVLDTASSLKDDKPIYLAVVQVRDASGAVVLAQKATQANGTFRIEFADKSKLTGKEQIWVDAYGYSAKPTTAGLKYPPPPGSNEAKQGDFLLTNNKEMRDNPDYRTTVAKNAAQAQANATSADARFGERARQVFASISALPPESKDAAFGSVKAQSEPAFSELLKVDREIKRTKEFEVDLKQKGSFIIPMYGPTGNIRLTGPVTSKDEMDLVIQQAGKKGFSGPIINDMHIQKR